MTWYHNTFDSWANGALITRAGTAADGIQISDIVLNNVSIGSGSNANCTAQTAAAVQGSTRGAQLTLAASASYLRYDEPVAGPRGSIRRSYKHIANPTADTVVAQMRSTAGVVAQAIVSNTGQMRATAGSGTVLTASNYTMTVGTTYFFELAATKGTTTTDGQIELYIYDATDTTLLNGSGAGYNSGATVNAGTTDINTFRWGGATNTTGWTIDQMDSIQGGVLTSGLWGPLPSAPAPTINVTRPAANLVDLRTSVANDSSTLTYPTPTRNSGPTLTVTSLTPGLWLFSQDPTTSSVYTVSVKQADNQTTVSAVTIATQATQAAAVKRSKFNGTSWV